MKALEPLNPGALSPSAPVPSTAQASGSSYAIQLPGVARVATSSPQALPTRQPSDAAGRRPLPPDTSGRRPAGAPPLQASFRCDESTQQMVVALTRPDTQEVIREMPPEKILRLIAALKQIAARTSGNRE